MNQNLKVNAISGLKWTTVGAIGLAIFQLLQISILTRFLPKEAFGLVAMALFIVNFTNIFVDLGFSSSILHKNNTTNNEYISIYWCNLIISGLLFLVIWLLAPLISEFYKEVELMKIIPILSFNLILMAIGRVHKTIMQKEFRFKHISLIDLLSSFVGLTSAYIFAKCNLGVYSLIYSTLIASGISSFFYLAVNFRRHAVSFHFNYKEIIPFFKVGSYTMGSQLVSFFSTDIDILIIGKVLGSGPLGLYTLSKQIVYRLYSFVNPIVTRVLSPFFAAIQEDKSMLKSYYLKILSVLSSINIPLYFLLAILSKEILTILYGSDYGNNTSTILSFLAIAYCTYSINNPVGSLQIATGRTDIGLKWAIISLIITPIVIYVSSLSNIYIVAFSRAFLSVILTIIPLWWIQIRPMVNIRLREYLQQFLKPSLIFYFLIGIYFIIAHFYELPFGVIVNSIIKASIGMLFYCGILWLIDKKKIFEILQIIRIRKIISD